MAVYESKVIQVYPSDEAEQRAIEAYEAGGWELVSSDRIQETHGDTRSTFIRLRFRRDKDMPNYAQIREASKTIEYLVEKKAGTTFSTKIFNAIGFIFLLISILLISSALESAIYFLPLAITASLSGILFYKGIKDSNSSDKAFKERYESELENLRRLVERSR